MTSSQYWDRIRKVQGPEGDLRPLGGRLLRKKETRLVGRAGMQPRQRRKTYSVGLRARRPYAPTGAMRRDDDDIKGRKPTTNTVHENLQSNTVQSA